MGGSVHRKAGKRDLWRVVIDVGLDPLTGKRKRMVRQVAGSKKQAQAELARLTHQMATGEYVAPSKVTVGAFLERWLDYMGDRLAPSARLSYTSIARNRLIPALGSVPLQALSTAAVVATEKAWLDSGRVRPSHEGSRARAGLSPKTVLNYHRVLVEALNDAVRWELVRTNVADRLHMAGPRAERPEAASLSLDEAQRLLEVLPRAPHGSALYCLMATGMRVGEVLGLRWRDVDLEGRVLRVQQQYDRVLKDFRSTKTHRSRRPIAMDADLVALLRRHKAAQTMLQHRAEGMWAESGLVFTDDLGGHLTHDRLAHALQRAFEVAGVGRVSPHGLRHTHASLLIQLGTHMKLIQERLGHASFAITADTYSHVAPDMQRAAADQFGAALRRRLVTPSNREATNGT